jgi:hypothetical protein
VDSGEKTALGLNCIFHRLSSRGFYFCPFFVRELMSSRCSKNVKQSGAFLFGRLFLSMVGEERGVGGSSKFLKGGTFRTLRERQRSETESGEVSVALGSVGGVNSTLSSVS